MTRKSPESNEGHPIEPITSSVTPLGLFVREAPVTSASVAVVATAVGALIGFFGQEFHLWGQQRRRFDDAQQAYLLEPGP